MHRTGLFSPLSALVLAPFLAACGGSEASPPGETAGQTASGGAGGTGTGTGAGGSSTVGTGGHTGTSTGSGGAAAGGGGQGGQGGAACPAGTIECDGTTKKVCDGKGGYTGVLNCVLQGGLACVPGYGCAVCAPGTGSCTGDVGKSCKDDGSGWEEETCDPVEAVTCDGATGRCTGACSAKALGTSYIGCEYFPTVTANLVAEGFHFAVAISNTSASDATVTVTKGAAAVASVVVAANSVQVVTLPWVMELKGPANNGGAPFPASLIAAQGAYRLRSTQPVTVYQFNPLEYTLGGQSSYSNDASLLLPTNAWTGTYRVAARAHWQGMSGLFAVTAMNDGTHVVLTAGPQGAIKGGVAGLDAAGNGTVTLNAGDVMEIVTSGGDVTGALVTSDKPVQVIGGHQCTFIPDNVGYCDHIEESIFPYETLSNAYLVTAPLVPNQGSPKVEMVRIVATVDATDLVFDPPQAGAPASIALAGQWIELASTAASFMVTGSQPILVVQYMEGQDAGGNSGDPAMALAVAKDQYRDSYLVHAPTNYESSYANIVAPAGVDVQVDGAVVGGFQPIGNTGYAVAFVPLSNAGDGNHNAKSSKPFGISVYGYGQYTSYWYAGGLNLEKLHQ